MFSSVTTLLVAQSTVSVGNLVAFGVTAIINKGVTATAQKTLQSPLFDDMKLDDFIGAGLEKK